MLKTNKQRYTSINLIKIYQKNWQKRMACVVSIPVEL
jgi:hypothetical protein